MLKVPVHPGEILKHEFLDEMGMSAGKLARHLGVPRTRIGRLCDEETSMTIDTAARLAAALGTTVDFWVNLQLNHDLAKGVAAVDVSHIGRLIAVE